MHAQTVVRPPPARWARPLSLLFTLAGCGGETVELAEHTAALSRKGAIVVDPRQQWHYDAIRLPQAWALAGQGSANTLVAVIDSGLWQHPDLDAAWEGGFNGICTSPPGDDFGTYRHGVHVAATIAGRVSGTTAFQGVCPGCKLMPINIGSMSMSPQCPANPTIPSLHARYIQAIDYAAGKTVGGYRAPRRASVINISSAPGLEPNVALCPADLQAAIDDAVALGVTVVVSAGNVTGTIGPWTDDAARFRWPNCRNVIVVAAASASGVIEPYSARGRGVTLAAPGGAAGPFDGSVPGPRGDGYGQLLGCTGAAADATGQGAGGVVSAWSAPVPGQAEVRCHRGWSGTSMAAPHVAGVVALMVDRNPLLRPAQIREILTRTARASSPCAVLGQCGAGMLDAAAAVGAATSAALLEVAPVDFGTTPIDVPVERAALLQSTGVAALAVSRMTISGGAGQIEFASLGCSGVTCETPSLRVDPGTSAPVTLRCAPQSPATIQATLDIHSNALGVPVTSVPLRCARPVVEPPALDFGAQWFGGGTTLVSPLALRNTATSGGPLRFVVRPVLRDEVTLSCTSPGCTCTQDAQGPRCDATVALASAVTLDVSFRGLALGERTGELLVSIDGQASPIRVPWRGRTVGGLRVVTDVDFGTVIPGVAAVRTLALFNDSDQPLDLYAAFRGDTVFTLDVGGPTRVLAHSSVAWNLRFSPTHEDSFGATLVVTHSGPGGGLGGVGDSNNVPQVTLRGLGGSLGVMVPWDEPAPQPTVPPDPTR